MITVWHLSFVESSMSDIPRGPRSSKKATPNSSGGSPQKQALSVWQRWNSLSFKVRLYIGVSTMAVAYGADRLATFLEEKNALEMEASKRVESELAKLDQEVKKA
ncbi:unnamed protein product [Kuraishia capsulata CBS 1993]|uniref:Uncharacterized protein n=1 Tax=Kuraishia capsulata CBS 1993 TaxID=1382522 RepID=W6MUX1_9ASCO|nr:uncharacterized protein KUCA_T00001936001 [Kuraishia capsulata CBS 1993]CDK25965.1 unnamed protein product [Kuraishia capsulata CBS 1993]